MLRDENWKRLKIVFKNCHHQMNSTCRCFIADNNHKNTGIRYLGKYQGDYNFEGSYLIICAL